MDAPNYATIILHLASEIDLLTKTFVSGGYKALSAALAKPLGSLCIIYIILIGFGITRGLIKTPMNEFIKGAVRMGLVYMLAMNWDLFSQYVVDLFTTGMSELGAVMMNLLPVKIPMIKGVGVNGGLQSVLIEIVRVGNWVWDTGAFRNPGPYLIALIVYAAGIAVVGLAFFELIVAKLMLSICLCTAPLFIVLTLFDKTRNFFDQWLGKVVGFSLVIFFVSVVIGFCLHLLHWCIGAHYLAQAANFKSVDWIPLFICACLAVMAIFEVVGMAKSIGGSCCTSGGSAMVGGFVGGAMGALSAGGATKAIGSKAGQLGKALLPGGKIANAGSLMAQKAMSKGGQAMKAIQQRMRGK
ncbi:TPA: type IV secretion system protein [Legionella pneumophila]|nr:type IV secretion system protein [Legionella pneumophila]HDS3863221.1 type IV secretion system protein [Legionella pneumophila]